MFPKGTILKLVLENISDTAPDDDPGGASVDATYYVQADQTDPVNYYPYQILGGPLSDLDATTVLSASDMYDLAKGV